MAPRAFAEAEHKELAIVTDKIDAPATEKNVGRVVRISSTRDLSRGFLFWIPGCLVFFRYQFKSGFDKIMGDAGDARLTVFGHEHWVQVFRGQVSWTSPQFFFPVKGVLGYADNYFLNEVFYLPLRAFGFDEFLAFQWTLILMSLVGFVSLFVFLRRSLKLGTLTCATLSTVFAFANNLYLMSGHLQLYSVYWLPLLMVLILKAWMSDRRGAQAAWGAFAGLLLGLLFFSTYYIAWFATVSAGIWMLIMMALRLRSNGVPGCIAALKSRLSAVIAFIVGFGLAIVPFLITYLPVLGSKGGRRYIDAMAFSAHPSDMFNLGIANYVWGATMRSAFPFDRLVNGELSIALTPELVVAALGAAVFVLVRRRSKAVGFVGQVCVACSVTLMVLIVLPVKFAWGSLWRIPWVVVPGAVGIRAIDRIELVGGLFAVIAVGAGLRLLDVRSITSRRVRAVLSCCVAAVLSFMVVAQLNVRSSSLIDRSDELQALILVPTPPAGCAAFYVVDSRPNTVPFYQANIDAMLISQRVGIPTLNGYSGQYPNDYTMIYPDAGEYSQQVQAWATAHHIDSGVCSYDRSARVWTGPEA